MPKQKDVVVIVVSPQQMEEEDYKQPSADWWFIDAIGNTVFLKHKDKNICVDYVNENYGKGKYMLKAVKLKVAKGELSCRGSVNSLSRKGSAHRNIISRQGM